MWHYQLVKKQSSRKLGNGRRWRETYYELHEVYRRKNGKPYAYTVEAVSPMGNSVEDMKGALIRMLYDCERYEPLTIKQLDRIIKYRRIHEEAKGRRRPRA